MFVFNCLLFIRLFVGCWPLAFGLWLLALWLPIAKSQSPLSHYHLLRLHIISVHEAHDVHACAEVVGRKGDVAVDGLADDDAARHVDHLQGGLTDVADAPFAAVEESEGLIAILVSAVRAEDELEARGVVRCLGLEAVARFNEQVDIGTGHIINKVEVVHLQVLGINGNSVAAVVFSLEADGHLTFVGAAHHGVVFAALLEVDAGAGFVQVELLHHAAVAKADDSIVYQLAIAVDFDIQVAFEIRTSRLFPPNRTSTQRQEP